MAESLVLTDVENELVSASLLSWRMDKQDEFLMDIFGILDRDWSGSLDDAEVFGALRALTGSATTEEAKEELADADTNKDGKISLEEFIEKMKAEF